MQEEAAGQAQLSVLDVALEKERDIPLFPPAVSSSLGLLLLGEGETLGMRDFVLAQGVAAGEVLLCPRLP